MIGDAIMLAALGAIIGLELRRRPPKGQALVEFALVLPVLLFILLAVIEMGAFGVRWVRWQSLASQMAVGATGGTLPPWWASEAATAACGAPAASLEPGDPLRVELSCDYRGTAVNGLDWRVTVEGIAADPSPSATAPSPGASPSPSAS